MVALPRPLPPGTMSFTRTSRRSAATSTRALPQSPADSLLAIPPTRWSP